MAKHFWFNIDRAAHTPPYRLSTVLGEEMNQFADFERGVARTWSVGPRLLPRDLGERSAAKK